VGKDLIEHPHLIDRGFGALVPDASESGQPHEEQVDLPDERLVEHHEAESTVGEQRSSPAVVGTVESRPDLIEVISGSQSPLPVVVLENVVAVSELARVPLRLGLVG